VVVKEVKERVRLGARSYNIVIGTGLLGTEAGRLIKGLGNNVLLVSNRRVFGLYGDKLGAGLSRAGVCWDKILLSDGERYKNMEAVSKIHDRLVRGRYDRDALVVALGGGVIGDIAGFAAATYMRGIRVVQMPTTLLSQVDSSVGGKTGVNHPKGKNLIGAFHQPSLVIADVGVLKTLPQAEVLSGVAEVIKYGCIASSGFFKFLEENIKALVALKPSVMQKVVRTSCKIKAEVVADDEREAGRRAILNFGHTAGHAIEAITEYKEYRHGHAVAMGMRVAAELSFIKGGLKGDDVGRITELIAKAGLPETIPKSSGIEALMRAMEHDKKVKSGTIRFALLSGVGHAEIRDDITKSEIREALKRSVFLKRSV